MLFNMIVSLINTVISHARAQLESELLFTALILSLVYIFQLMILLPALGWCLFYLGISKKLPLLWALLVPFGIQICDHIVNHDYISKHVFAPIYNYRWLLNFLGAYINLPPKSQKLRHEPSLSCSKRTCDLSHYQTMSFSSTGLSPTFLVSTAICIALIIASIQIRSRSFGNNH